MAAALRPRLNLKSDFRRLYSLSKHLLHVGQQVLAHILSPLPTVQILLGLIIDQSGCFGLIMYGLGQELIKMAPHFARKCRCKERYHPLHPNPASCVASNMCASARNVIITPPPQTSCVAFNMCASSRNVIIPHRPRPVAQHSTCVQVQGTLSSPPSQPSILRSILHVCKCKERYYFPPHPRPVNKIVTMLNKKIHVFSRAPHTAGSKTNIFSNIMHKSF